MKTAIIFASRHHGNTRKLVEAIAKQHQVVTIDVRLQSQADLSEYDLIGVASGIDFGRFYKPVEFFLLNHLPENKRVFFLYTCGNLRKGFTDRIKACVLEKGSIPVGEYGCPGFNTYGPLQWIGGINRGRPSEEDCAAAVRFYESLL